MIIVAIRLLVGGDVRTGADTEFEPTCGTPNACVHACLYCDSALGRLVLAQAVVSQQWQHVAHHKAHASLAMWDSGFERPLILSYDGGGNDGSMMFFTGGKKPFELNAVDYIWNSSSTKMTEKQRRKCV